MGITWDRSNRTFNLTRQVMVVVLIITALGLVCTPATQVPAQERRVQALNRVIMCPVCPGESIDQSQNELAAQMREIVSDKLEQGWSEDQIKNFFVERYGPSVLLMPPRKGFSLVVWIVPPIGVLSAGLCLYVVMRKMRRPRPNQSLEAMDLTQLSEEEQSDYFHRVEDAIVTDEEVS